jgi:AraC-like DNA-binding protein
MAATAMLSPSQGPPPKRRSEATLLTGLRRPPDFLPSKVSGYLICRKNPSPSALSPGSFLRSLTKTVLCGVFVVGDTDEIPLHTLSFDDFSDMVMEATVNFLLIERSLGPWSVWHCALDSIVLQFGAEGGSKILHGISRPDALGFILQDRQISDHLIFDGHILQSEDFVVLPPGSDFTFATTGSHRWMSVTMPVGLFEVHAAAIGRSDLARIGKEKRVISPPKQLLDCFTASAAGAAALVRNRGMSALKGPRQELVSGLLNALSAAITGSYNEVSLPTRKSRSTSDAMTKALEYVRGQQWGGTTVEDLASAADVTSRTLLRMFRQQLGIGPASYLKMRQLNIVRRALRGKLGSSSTITNIMSEHGVTEFGRFASEYRALFGERPSDTVARSRAQIERRTRLDSASHFSRSDQTR